MLIVDARRLSERLARSVAFVREQAPATGTRATMKCDVGVARRGRLLGQPLPPQLLHAGTDCLEIVSCSGPWHHTSGPRTNMA